MFDCSALTVSSSDTTTTTKRPPEQKSGTERAITETATHGIEWRNEGGYDKTWTRIEEAKHGMKQNKGCNWIIKKRTGDEAKQQNIIHEVCHEIISAATNGNWRKRLESGGEKVGVGFVGVGISLRRWLLGGGVIKKNQQEESAPTMRVFVGRWCWQEEEEAACERLGGGVGGKKKTPFSFLTFPCIFSGKISCV